jgi:uncharacterized protein YbjT (DUF2867 family)
VILIIGATGQTGGAAAKALVAAGQKVRAAVRNTAKAEGLRQLGVEVVQADAEDTAALKSALAGADKLLLATGAEKRLADVQTNIINTAKGSVNQIAKISAIGAAPDAPVEFLRAHSVAERALAESGVPYTIIQPASFMQNFFSSAPTIAAQNAIVLPTGNAKVAQIDVRDIGTFAATVLTHPGHDAKTYVISSRDSLTGSEIAEHLSLALGKRLQFISPDPEQHRQTLISYGLPEWTATALTELYKWLSTGAAAGVTDTFREVTGKEPISFDQFAKDHAQVFLQAAAGA